MNSRSNGRGIAFLFLTALLMTAAPAANAQAIHVRWVIIQPAPLLWQAGPYPQRPTTGPRSH
jgi:hypothetical protein